MKILISGCLIGLDCKYNLENNLNEECIALKKNHLLIPVCPEQLGGLATPRAACEIINGNGASVLAGLSRVINDKDEDVTEAFIKGAEETLKFYRLLECDLALLKSRSPSCGLGKIYDGTFSGKLREGNGVTTEILLKNGIMVLNETDTENLLY